MSFLKSRGILSVFHYVPLHTSPVGQSMGGGDACCPATEEASNRLVRLPFYNSLGEPEQEQVVKAILDFGSLKETRIRRQASISVLVPETYGGEFEADRAVLTR